MSCPVPRSRLVWFLEWRREDFIPLVGGDGGGRPDTSDRVRATNGICFELDVADKQSWWWKRGMRCTSSPLWLPVQPATGRRRRKLAKHPELGRPAVGSLAEPPRPFHPTLIRSRLRRFCPNIPRAFECSGNLRLVTFKFGVVSSTPTPTPVSRIRAGVGSPKPPAFGSTQEAGRWLAVAGLIPPGEPRSETRGSCT